MRIILAALACGFVLWIMQLLGRGHNPNNVITWNQQPNPTAHVRGIQAD